MPTFTRVIVAACVVLVAALPGEGQPRDPATTGIRGRVVAAESGTPLAGVRVSIQMAQRVDGPAGAGSRTATTDATGTFELPDLPPGDYRLTPSKTGYLPRLPGRDAAAGDHVMVGTGQPPAPVTIQMVRAGAIEGRLLDAEGEPVARVRISAERYRYAADGQRTASPTGIADITDDLGQFRVHGLPAGDFRILASGPAPSVAQVWPSPVDKIAAPVYYPGTVNAADTQVISLPVGGEASVQFSFVRARLVRVSGTVVRPSGAPSAGLVLRLGSRSGDSTTIRHAGTVGPDGAFEISGVAPGDYWLEVDSVDPQAPVEGASVPITVTDEDLAGMVVVMTAGAAIGGTVVFEGNRPRPASFRLAAVPVGGTRQAIAALSRRDTGARVLDDGRFRIGDVTGRVLLQSEDDDWIVTSTIVDGEEHVDAVIDVAGRGAIEGVRVTVTNRHGSVRGRVADASDRPLADHVVAVLRTEQTGIVSQRVRLVRTDPAGRFSISRLRPGTYVAGVAEDLEDNYHLSPAFQERLRSRGHGFVLREGDAMTLDLSPTAGLP